MKLLLYPKTYATIDRVEPGSPARLVVRTDAGNIIELSARWRNGRGSSAALTRGARVKIYQRPGVPLPNFRRVGS